MAVEVVIVSPTTSVAEDNSGTTVVEIVSTTGSIPEVTVTGAAVEVVGGISLLNAVVSPTAPASPYEGQVWIDIS